MSDQGEVMNLGDGGGGAPPAPIRETWATRLWQSPLCRVGRFLCCCVQREHPVQPGGGLNRPQRENEVIVEPASLELAAIAIDPSSAAPDEENGVALQPDGIVENVGEENGTGAGETPPDPPPVVAEASRQDAGEGDAKGAAEEQKKQEAVKVINKPLSGTLTDWEGAGPSGKSRVLDRGYYTSAE